MLSFFDKRLKDVIIAYRRTSDKKTFLSQTVSDVKKNLSDKDFEKKKNAAEILIFLYLEGVPIDFAAFSWIELMSAKKLSQRRIGFQIGSIALRDKNDVLMLTVGTFKKTLMETFEQKYISMGINCFTSVCTSEISQNLYEDVIPLFNSTSVMVRRKACTSWYKLMLWYPDCIPALQSYLSDALHDVSISVQIAAVTVMYEISRTNPKVFMLTVPQLFELFKSENNWLIIKLIKLMHEIIKVEPRMIKKLSKTYQHLLVTTKAKSVEIDLIREIITHFRSQEELFSLAKDKIMEYFDSDDNNLLYLGLSAIKCIMLNNDDDTLVYKNKIVQCFKKYDITVRRAALNCIQSVVTVDNAREIVNDLMTNINELEYGVQEDQIIHSENEQENSKEDKKEKQDFDQEKLDDEDEGFVGEFKKRVKLSFSDSDKSYRDLQIRTVLRILMSNDYYNVNGDYQWWIDVMLNLGIYKGDRVDRLIAESLRQLFLKIDDSYKKNGVPLLINWLMNTVKIKKNEAVLNYSFDFIDFLLFTISENSSIVGAVKASQVLEYLRKYKEALMKTLIVTKSALCELIFRLSLIELHSNAKNKGELDIIQDRIRLFNEIVNTNISKQAITDMRYNIYVNILENIGANWERFIGLGQIDKLLDQISDLGTLFDDPIVIGGSKIQHTIAPPDCLDEPFDINQGEFDFEIPKSDELKSMIKNGDKSENDVKQENDIPDTGDIDQNF